MDHLILKCPSRTQCHLPDIPYLPLHERKAISRVLLGILIMKEEEEEIEIEARDLHPFECGTGLGRAAAGAHGAVFNRDFRERARLLTALSLRGVTFCSLGMRRRKKSHRRDSGLKECHMGPKQEVRYSKEIPALYLKGYNFFGDVPLLISPLRIKFPP